MSQITQMPIDQRCLRHSGRAAQRWLKPLLIGLFQLAPAVALAIPEVTAQSEATVSKAPQALPQSPKKMVRAKTKQAADLMAMRMSPKSVVAVPIVPPSAKRPAVKAAENEVQTNYSQRPYIEVSGLGLLIGDYQLQPRLAFSTDNRLDDSNTRERAMRDDIDAVYSRKRGEVHEDMISRWLRTRGQGGIPGTDPGYQVAYAIQRVLQGGVQLPQFLNYSPAPNTYRPSAEKH